MLRVNDQVDLVGFCKVPEHGCTTSLYAIENYPLYLVWKLVLDLPAVLPEGFIHKVTVWFFPAAIQQLERIRHFECVEQGNM